MLICIASGKAPAKEEDIIELSIAPPPNSRTNGWHYEVYRISESVIMMNDCYLLKQDSTPALQAPSHDSFIGGIPKLRVGVCIPCCTLCGAAESFFFQVALPPGNPWGGLSLAVFACTSCADENELIPEMLSVPPLGADIPEGFLDAYQTNFRLLVFETTAAVPHVGYQERVKFKPIHLEKTGRAASRESKIGGKPSWMLGDESPATYNGKTPMFFLLQLWENLRFDLVPGAPKQMDFNLDGLPERSSEDYYELFIGNRIFMFGTVDRSSPLVYAITQVD